MVKQLDSQAPLKNQLKYLDKLFLILLAVLGLVAFILTSSHTVTFEDSGLFLSTIKTLGLPQPPGYPLYIVLAHYFGEIPFGTYAQRIHFFSHLCGIGSALNLYYILRRLDYESKISFLSSTVFLFSLTLWSQSIVAEVYPLHIFLFSVVLVLSLTLRQNYNIKKKVQWSHVIILSLFVGLSVANHWPLFALSSPLILFLLTPLFFHKNLFKKIIVGFVISVTLAFLFYWHMMWRSHHPTALTFLGPIDNFKELWDYFLRSYYKTLESKWNSSLSEKSYFWLDFLKNLIWQEWLYFGFIFLIGFYLQIKKYFLNTKNKYNSQNKNPEFNSQNNFTRDYFFGLIFGIFLTPFVLPFVISFEFNVLNQKVLQVFYLTPYFCATLIMAEGFQFIFEKMQKQGPLLCRSLFSILVVTVLLMALKNAHINNLRGDQFAEDYARILLLHVPRGTEQSPQHLIAGTDADVGPLSYLRYVLQERKDVRLYTQSGVFFNDRIFDPFIFENNKRFEKTIEFLKQKISTSHPIVYSTKTLDIIGSRTDLSLSFNYNGLIYEITDRVILNPSAPKDHTLLVKMTHEALTRYLHFQARNNWQYHREVLASRLCNWLLIKNESIEKYWPIRSCFQVQARHYAHIKNYEKAHEFYNQLLLTSDSMIAAERHSLRYFWFINRLAWINSMKLSLDEKKSLFLQAAQVSRHALVDYKNCNNSVATVILSLEGQIQFPQDFNRELEFFKRCKK